MLSADFYRKLVAQILDGSDIEINGSRPWDIKIMNERFYRRVILHGSLGLGEAYMNGWWQSEDIEGFIRRLLKNKIHIKFHKNPLLALYSLPHLIFNLQSSRWAFKIGDFHYDLSNEFYRNMLDKRMTYTCGYWKNAANLDEAQEHKLDMVCRKLKLEPGQKILDIGCGWGSLVKFAAENYGVKALGVTVSKEQVKLARELCRGLPVEIKYQDYRKVEGKFDHIVSLGMFEHVGWKNYRVYMQKVHDLLVDDGLFLLHTIGNTKTVRTNDPWIDKYIFPGSMLPSPPQVAKAAEKLFIIEDWHNYGTDYTTTLHAWHKNFVGNWDKFKAGLGDRFFRMWEYYLLACAGSFSSRNSQLWQIVFSKGVEGGYISIR